MRGIGLTKVFVVVLAVLMLGAWSFPGLDKKSKEPQTKVERSSNELKNEKYDKFVKGLKITRDLLDRFIKAYPEYIKIMESCSVGMDEADNTQAMQITKKCLNKIKNALRKYRFDYQTFPAVIARISTAYAIASMQDSPLAGMVFSKGMQKSLQDAGQKELSSKELNLVKKYLSKLDALFNQN